MNKAMPCRQHRGRVARTPTAAAPGAPSAPRTGPDQMHNWVRCSLVVQLLLLWAHVTILLSGGADALSRRGAGDQDWLERYGVNRTAEIPLETLQAVIQGVSEGNKDSLYFFALLKYYGHAVTQDQEAALKYFREAAQRGNPDAQLVMGIMLYEGDVVGQDVTAAAAWFNSAYKSGSPDAAMFLGKFYMDGIGVPQKNVSRALELFYDAAAGSVPEAFHYLGLLHEYGIGGIVKQDFLAAARWYSKGHDKAYLESTYNLGLMFTYGRGVGQDFTRASELFQKAAKQSHAPSVYYLGILTTNGLGVDVDYVKALTWFTVCKDLPDDRVSSKCAEHAAELEENLKLAREKNRLAVADFDAMLIEDIATEAATDETHLEHPEAPLDTGPVMPRRRRP